MRGARTVRRCGARAVRRQHPGAQRQRAGDRARPDRRGGDSVSVEDLDQAPVVVRATVTRGDRRADLALPGTIPVAELLPGLVRRLGALGLDVVHADVRLLTADGQRLRTDASLAVQGVQDGAVLALHTESEEGEQRYDDIVEAVAEAVERETPPWSVRDSARTAVAAACALLVTAALVLVGADLDAAASAAVAGSATLLALVAAAVLDRSPAPPVAARSLGVLGCALAALAGYLLAGGPTRLGEGSGSATALAAAGAAGLGAAVVLAVTTTRVRTAAVAPGVPAVVALLLGGVTLLLDPSSAPAATVVTFALLAVATLAVPWLALSATPLRVVAPREDAEILADPPPVDPEAVRAQALAGHWLVVALRTGIGATLVLLTPAVVATGPAGGLLAVAVWVALALGVRQSVARTDVAAALISSAIGLLVATVTAALLQPTWRAALSVALLVAAFAVVVAAFLGQSRRLRLERVGDALRLLLLAAVPPLAVVAAGGLG
ncbi:type VII secretion integral membrane protein EccD [Miniimonas arenae]|uniref:Type VII secretion integral membrane protein EccD n=1 Tax=Miniimonas arenae TaxID=676201 RepID=A0A5C5BDZ8_9MICO|nr:type VII secretion integral membrane protein EccD [Miniimonas arenae]